MAGRPETCFEIHNELTTKETTIESATMSSSDSPQRPAGKWTMIIGINVISGLLLLLGGVGGIWGTFTPYLGAKGGSLPILGGSGGRAPIGRQPEAVIEFWVGKALLVTYGCLLALAGPMYPSTKEKDRYLLFLVLILAALAVGLTFLPILHPFSRIMVPFWNSDPPNEIFDKFFGLFLQSGAVVAVLVGACMKATHEWKKNEHTS